MSDSSDSSDKLGQSQDGTSFLGMLQPEIALDFAAEMQRLKQGQSYSAKVCLRLLQCCYVESRYRKNG